jgi:hypothetical protein
VSVTIRAYSNLTLTAPHEYADEACHETEHLRAFAYLGFEASTRGLVDYDKPFEWGGTPCIGGRCYRPTLDTVEHEILSDGYEGYGKWREALAGAALGVDIGGVWANPDAWADQPFYELLNFADNEGVIGPDAAFDLLSDFGGCYPKAPEGWDQLEWKRVGAAWIDGLALAANGGLVRFA